jgi:hypothetical protein
MKGYELKLNKILTCALLEYEKVMIMLPCTLKTRISVLFGVLIITASAMYI